VVCHARGACLPLFRRSQFHATSCGFQLIVRKEGESVMGSLKRLAA
jgi:hypothetical protein